MCMTELTSIAMRVRVIAELAMEIVSHVIYAARAPSPLAKRVCRRFRLHEREYADGRQK